MRKMLNKNQRKKKMNQVKKIRPRPIRQKKKIEVKKLSNHHNIFKFLFIFLSFQDMNNDEESVTIRLTLPLNCKKLLMGNIVQKLLGNTIMNEIKGINNAIVLNVSYIYIFYRKKNYNKIVSTCRLKELTIKL